MRLLIQHRSHYRYPRAASLGPHQIRLRPATHAKAAIETYALSIPQPCQIRWQQDPNGNHVAHVVFDAEVEALDVDVEIVADIRPVNPFDFWVEERCKRVPFAYSDELTHDLQPYLATGDETLATGARFRELSAALPTAQETVPLLVALNTAVNKRLKYVIREEAGIWTPEETLENGRGSCRDFAVLLIALARQRGLAARFASGYLVQLTDEGMLPDAPRGVSKDVVDLHAWAEIYLPGAGWIGLDATSGLFCGEGHIPLACTATPALAAPLEGTSTVGSDHVDFSMRVLRLGHEPRPTKPYDEPVWEALLAAGDATDAALTHAGVNLTMGGEPTFNSREAPEAPEWNGAALGGSKWSQGLRLAHELRRRLSPGSALLWRTGKTYPGESLPRWALELCGRKNGQAVWPDRKLKAPGPKDAERLATRLAALLEVGPPEPAYEDPWRFLQNEAALPTDVDPLTANLTDSEERRRLARVLERDLGAPSGYVVPVIRDGGRWRGERWTFRRGHLFLLQGDSPIGLRLPLASLPKAEVDLTPPEEPVVPRDPRRGKETKPAKAAKAPVRTAACVELRDDTLFVFVPPSTTADDFFAMVALIDRARAELDVEVQLEGYPPPGGGEVYRLSVTPDPGVLEVNLPVTTTTREHAALFDAVFDGALHAGLHSEKYLLDGRMAGSGGGNHLTFGGPAPLESPFVTRPALLASLITFLQHHPSLSYLFTGLFVGPTSQAPRIDEARHDSLYELEIALTEAFERRDPPPWLADALFRNLLVDVTGNTHRAEICIDKLFDWRTPHGRQGVVELRAFEMPPHPRMATAQMLLLRALLASFAQTPYDKPLVRWGAALHDRFLLPYWLWRDLEDVLAYLKAQGFTLPADAYLPFLTLRCPLVGRLQAGDVILELRNAMEPWHVLGEEPAGAGTSRYVDSSMERIEVRAIGLIPERHVVAVNGWTVPLSTTATAGESVGGVRFRAWAPPHSLHPHLGIHHPLRFDVVDTWGERSLGACGYHVWHPEGRAFAAAPLTRFEAAARRAQRFTIEGPLQHPVSVREAQAHPDAPYTLDLRRLPIDRPMPQPRPGAEETTD
ncbi:MAG: transglutaminase family protein [Myxococcota bacterium]|nr:transglutaminase family protein [Myxococcota bacterium]